MLLFATSIMVGNVESISAQEVHVIQSEDWFGKSVFSDPVGIGMHPDGTIYSIIVETCAGVWGFC